MAEAFASIHQWPCLTRREQQNVQVGTGCPQEVWREWESAHRCPGGSSGCPLGPSRQPAAVRNSRPGLPGVEMAMGFGYPCGCNGRVTRLTPLAAPSVVVFTTYPIVKPRHGGQIRTRALVEKYGSAGFEVAHLAVYEQGAFPRDAIGPIDVAFDKEDARWFFEGREIPQTADLRCGRFAAEADDVYRQILRSLPKTIDVFHVEQPWLLPLVKRLKTEPRFAHAVVVYGSQNVEAPLRNAIFRQLSIRNGDGFITAIHALEEDACRYAQLTLAVAPADLETMSHWGAKKMLLAPNGISAWEAPARKVEEWREKLGLRRVVLFVGSGHAPNVDGFLRAFGHGLGFIPPDCKIVMAGSVGPVLREHYLNSRYSSLDLSRIEVTGEIDNDDLSALKTLADVFLLPIFEGGGSNIKTAEAIYSGKQVLATSTSLRGYDAFLHLPEINVANTQAEFRAAVARIVAPDAPSPRRGVNGVEVRSKLLWNSCLEVVPPAVKGLLAETRA
ncbi:MAG: glycosyltransferase [Myxococcaceae bacterium]